MGRSRRRCRLARGGVILAAAAMPALAGPPTSGRDASDYQRLLGRPYRGMTPFPGNGRNLWVTHTRDWGFPAEVNYFHLDLLGAFRLDLAWEGQPVGLGPGWAHLGHLESQALPVGDLAYNPARSGLPSATTSTGPAPGLLDGDRRAIELWFAPPGSSEVVIAWPTALRAAGVLVTLVEDAGRGAGLPDALAIDWDGGSGWTPVSETGRLPSSPAAGPNWVAFAPVDALRLRLRIVASTASALSEVEAYAPGAMPLELIERKFVRADDVLVSVLSARNLGDRPATFAVRAASDLTPAAGGRLRGTATLHAIPLWLELGMAPGTLDGNALTTSQPLGPGELARVVVAMPFARTAVAAEERLASALASPDPVGEKESEAAAWLLANLPRLDVPDPWFERTFAFRGALLRRALGDPDFGPIRHPAFVEGRWAAPWYPRVISFGAPHQLREARWLGDGSLARGHALNFIDNQAADGGFRGLTTDGQPGNEYTDWIAGAITDVFAVTGDTDLLARARAAQARNLERSLSRDGNANLLPRVDDHFMTGMEWQPSFFYFSGYDASRPTPLERVDDASALFKNARGAAEAARLTCDPGEAARLDALAEAVRAAAVATLWDEPTGFYLSARESDGARAPVKEIAGYWPHALELAPPGHDRALAALFDPAEFATAYPPASSSLACPATSQDGWPVGPGGSASMWNGPTWPHATSMAIEAVARGLRRSGEAWVARGQLFAMFASYTRAHYEGPGWARDFDQPAIGEDYRGDTGWWKTGERDYFHSTYLDLVIRFLVGLEPGTDDRVRLDPLLPAGTWDHFLLENLRYRGHDLVVAWDAPGGPDWYGDGRQGYELWIDGRLAAERPDLGPLAARLPPDVLLAAREPASGLTRFSLRPEGGPWSLFRSPAPSLDRAVLVDGSPFAATATDPAPPPASLVFYRAGACGPGR